MKLAIIVTLAIAILGSIIYFQAKPPEPLSAGFSDPMRTPQQEW